jgi:hypothetical protein
LSGTSENWRRTSRSCITVVRRDKWKNQRFPNVPVRQTNLFPLGLLYKRALFDLQFVHNLFWLKLKWNAKSKLFYCIIYRSSMLWWSSRTLIKLKSQSQKRFKEWKYQYWNIRTRITPERTRKNYRISIWRQMDKYCKFFPDLVEKIH